jgi:hypothetical protein
MARTEIMDLTRACPLFPEVSDNDLPRDNVLNGIDDYLSKGITAVILEGDSGIGKTTILARFARRHADRSLSLFIGPSAMSRDCVFIRFCLCNQIEWALRGTELQDIAQADLLYLRDGILRLQRRVGRTGLDYRFIVDGLDDLTSDMRNEVLAMLPLRVRGFRFVVSGSADTLPEFRAMNRDIVKCCGRASQAAILSREPITCSSETSGVTT